MLFSILTPVHPASLVYLSDAYRSLLEQTHSTFEWILVENGGARVPEFVRSDARVVVVPFTEPGAAGAGAGPFSIGALKRFAASAARGDVLVELDADDLLTPDALSSLAEAFSDARVMMAYSNDAQFRTEPDGSWSSPVFSEYYGWRSRPFEYKGRRLNEMLSWGPSAQSMRFIYWAPDHVRAWRRTAYEAVGGHDAALAVGDDHDLCCRFYIAYGAGGLRHIDRCLYLYRLHDDNSSRLYNAAVQEATLASYLRYSRAMATRWADDEGLRKLDLGGRFGAWPGYETVDRHQPADILCDLEEPWPFEDNSVGVVKAYHIFEHLRDPIHAMNEAFRVLAPGGFLFVEVPSTDGRGAWQDPTHISFFNQNSFAYYTDERYARYIRPGYTGRFQAARVVTFFPSDYEREHNIPYVQADLIALKGAYAERPAGEVLI